MAESNTPKRMDPATNVGQAGEVSGEYYRNLVTDDEVVAALLKDSKRREGTLTPERMKPNINFLQRTVSSLVSNNTRIDEDQDNFKTTYSKENVIELQVLHQIRLEKAATTSRKANIDEFEKDIFLRTAVIDFQKSNEVYNTTQQNDAVLKEPTTSKNDLDPSKKTKIKDKMLSKEFLKKELRNLQKKIEIAKQKKAAFSTSVNKKACSKAAKINLENAETLKSIKKQNSEIQVNAKIMSKEELLRHELASLDAKIQQKLLKMKTEDTILILDKEENTSDLETVNLDSGEEETSTKTKKNEKTSKSKVNILQNIEISTKKNSEEDIRRRMVSRIKQNQSNLVSMVKKQINNDFVCTKCGSCSSNEVVDRKPCTAIKCEIIELSSSTESDLELVSVKIESKAKKKKKTRKGKTRKIVVSRGRTFSKDSKSSRDRRYSSRDTSTSSDTSKKSWDREREDRNEQRENTYNARKASFKSSIKNRTQSIESSERETSSDRKTNLRERDHKKTLSKNRQARSFSRFSSDASYDRCIKKRYNSKSKSRSRSGSRGSKRETRKIYSSRSRSRSRSRSGSRDNKRERSRSKDSVFRESSTDSEQERHQSYMLSQQRFEERARREYWMNRIIREYQNRYRIPRIPQRDRLMENKKNDPPIVQSKIVVVSQKEQHSFSDSCSSRRKESMRGSRSPKPFLSVESQERDSSENNSDYCKYDLNMLETTDKMPETTDRMPETLEKMHEAAVQMPETVDRTSEMEQDKACSIESVNLHENLPQISEKMGGQGDDESPDNKPKLDNNHPLKEDTEPISLGVNKCKKKKKRKKKEKRRQICVETS